MVKKSAQSGFYRVIQNPPFNFTLHAVPLRFAEIGCRNRMRQAYYKCLDAYEWSLQCDLKLDPEQCRTCEKTFLLKYEKGVDVALAAQLVIFGSSRITSFDRVILVAGNGDYQEATRFCRQELGKDLQLVCWRRSPSKELQKLANKDTVFLDDIWQSVFEIRAKPPLEQTPAADEVTELEGE